MCTISSNMNLIFHTDWHCGVFVVYCCMMCVLMSVVIDARQDHYLVGHWNSILMAQLDMYIRNLSICYQYMPLTQHELLRCETLYCRITYIMMHYAVQCIALHHTMVLYRALHPMMPNPFISYHEIVMLDTCTLS